LIVEGLATKDRPFVLHDVSVRYRRAESPVLSGIDLEVEQGEFVGIVGPTGCGKTSLLNVLAGVIPHYTRAAVAGDVRIFGRDTHDLNLRKISGEIGLVLQDPEAQIFNLIVRDEIVWGLENRGLSRSEMAQRLTDALEVFSMQHLERRVTYDLSGGEKQRVAIASIYALSPDVILLDDPTSQLDPIGAASVIQVVNKLAATGDFTIVMVEDNVDEVLENAHRVVLLSEGRIVLDSSPRGFCENREVRDSVGIKASQVVELHYRLADRGLINGPPPLTLTEATERYASILSGDGSLPEGEAQPPKESAKAPPSQIQSDGGSEGERSHTVLAAEEIEFTYPPPREIRALELVDSSFSAGEFVAILGENGSGKTTLAKCLSGYLRPTRGRVVAGDKNVASMSPSERVRRVGYVFQNPDHQLFKETVWEEVAFGLRNIGASEEEVEISVTEVLTALELDSKSGLHPFQLSKGDRQRLAVASVSVLSPELLIIDEPTTGQDPVKAREVMDLLLELNQAKGMTIVVISHAMDLVAEYARRSIVMHQGRVLIAGPTREVFAQPGTLRLTGITPPPVTRLALDLGLSPLPITVPEAAEFIERRVDRNRLKA
jgi:energy-coupling factor transporter ATP-binding protein EcfA2